MTHTGKSGRPLYSKQWKLCVKGEGPGKVCAEINWECRMYLSGAVSHPRRGSLSLSLARCSLLAARCSLRASLPRSPRLVNTCHERTSRLRPFWQRLRKPKPGHGWRVILRLFGPSPSQEVHYSEGPTSGSLGGSLASQCDNLVDDPRVV